MSAPRRGERAAEQPRATLSIAAVVAIIVGIVIGAGIFRMPSLVATFAASETVVHAGVARGRRDRADRRACATPSSRPRIPARAGTITSCSAPTAAICRSSSAGRARSSSFPARSLSCRSCSATTSRGCCPLGEHGTAIYAALLAVVLTLVNVAGIRAGLGDAELAYRPRGGRGADRDRGGAVGGRPGRGPAGSRGRGGNDADKAWHAGIGMVMLFVLFTYSGWNESAYISAEVKDAQRNMVRALVHQHPARDRALPAGELGLPAGARAAGDGQVPGGRGRPAREGVGPDRRDHDQPHGRRFGDHLGQRDDHRRRAQQLRAGPRLVDLLLPRALGRRGRNADHRAAGAGRHRPRF